MSAQFCEITKNEKNQVENGEFFATIESLNVYSKKQNSITCYIKFKLTDQSDSKIFPSEDKNEVITGKILQQNNSKNIFLKLSVKIFLQVLQNLIMMS